MLIDTHAHLFWESFQQDFDDVIDRAIQAGLSTIINVGVDLETSQLSVNLKSDKIQFYSSIGIHPTDTQIFNCYSDESIHNYIKEVGDIYLKNISKVIAVGECGLDYNFRDFASFNPHAIDQLKQLQKKLFKSQIELSKKLDLPLLIHCRDAWSDIFNNLQDTKGLFHTFTGSMADAKKALDLGYYLSFSGIITYPKNEYLREIVKNTPLDRILTETDCPFLPPQGKRGQRNEPANIKEIVQLIAEEKELSFAAVADQVFQNATKLFDFQP